MHKSELTKQFTEPKGKMFVVYVYKRKNVIFLPNSKRISNELAIDVTFHLKTHTHTHTHKYIFQNRKNRTHAAPSIVNQLKYIMNFTL